YGPSRLLLPPALRRLLPVGDLAAGLSGSHPLRARFGDGGGIAALEQVDDARVGREVARLGTVDQEAHAGAVGILPLRRQIDRLGGGIAVAPGAVRQEAVVAPGPQQGVERLDALLGARLHDRAPAALQRLLHEARQ